MNADLHHLSGAYAVDALDGAERAAFESHLLGCADCRAEVAEPLASAAGAALTEWQDTEATAEAAGVCLQVVLVALAAEQA